MYGGCLLCPLYPLLFVLTGYFPVGIAPASVIGIFDYQSLSDVDLI